jgi:transcriptional regulator with XRE-family HTH domain
MSVYGSTAMSRELGHEMRRRRDATGLTLRDLAATLGWSISRMCRIENGTAPVSDVELTHYLAHAGLSLGETLELVRFRQSSERGYWLSPHGLWLEDSLTSLAFHESSAIATTNYEPIVVHGLLQTEDYARAMISRETWRNPQNVESCVRDRMDRQAVLKRARHVFYLHEQALRVHVASPTVMHEQILKLVLLAELNKVKIRVVPLSAGERSVFGNSFSLFEYDGGKPLLYLDNHATGAFFEDPDYVDPFVLLVPSIARVALDARQSQELLAAVASDYERAGGGAGARDHRVAEE